MGQSAVEAANWQEIKVDNDARTAIDRASVNLVGGVTEAWFRIFYYAGGKVPESARVGSPQAVPVYSYVLMLLAFDCSRKTIATLQTAYYNTADEVVGRWSAVATPRELAQHIVPESVGEHYLEEACRRR